MYFSGVLVCFDMGFFLLLVFCLRRLSMFLSISLNFGSSIPAHKSFLFAFDQRSWARAPRSRRSRVQRPTLRRQEAFAALGHNCTNGGENEGG